MWGGQGQIMTLQVLACFLLHRLSLYATNEEKVEQPVFKNTLSLLVELCDVLSKPGLAIE